MMNSMFLCSYCPKTFVDKRQLKLHQRYHLKENFKCLACDKSFTSRQSFNAHSSLHKESIFSCGECFKTFNHQSNLIAHQRLHYGKFSCTYCYKNFSRRDDLHDHLSNCQKSISTDLQNFEQETTIILIPIGKTDKKDDVNENKEVSNKNYEVPSLIDDNESSAKKLKTCLICDAQVIHLTKHMKVHNKDYSEQCYICDKKFPLKKYLQVHMKTHDPKKSV